MFAIPWMHSRIHADVCTYISREVFRQLVLMIHTTLLGRREDELPQTLDGKDQETAEVEVVRLRSFFGLTENCLGQLSSVASGRRQAYKDFQERKVTSQSTTSLDRQ